MTELREILGMKCKCAGPFAYTKGLQAKELCADHLRCGSCNVFFLPHSISIWVRILVQVMIYRRLLIGRDGHLDQSEAYDIS